ncbi:hypothetical protein [Streptomyces niveus]|uniref:Helix-turn-helix domain-containing protein n=1 Tax=Streptomyces niveus TaxID=193462 RepID=A0ABZ2A3Y6_STRNV|nr:hypothetical protein [Streptomyces niveus]
MRIYRTKPTRSFTTVTNALVRDRSISWCASGVLMYLLSLPNNARADIRSLAGQRKEGRARITDALHDLERAGYLRRVLVKNKKSGELSTVYEVFDHPCTDRVTAEPAEPAENGQNLASGDRDRDDTGSLPKGEKTGEQRPPSRPLPKLTVPEQLRSATELLLSLRGRDPRLTLGTAEAVRLAPLVGEWREAGASDAQLREALTGGLPVRVLSAPGLLADRLRRKLPTRLPRPVPPALRPECPDCGTPLPPSSPCHACTPPPPPPEASAFVAAARRGRALAREALTGGACAVM